MYVLFCNAVNVWNVASNDRFIDKVGRVSRKRLWISRDFIQENFPEGLRKIMVLNMLRFERRISRSRMFAVSSRSVPLLCSVLFSGNSCVAYSLFLGRITTGYSSHICQSVCSFYKVKEIPDSISFIFCSNQEIMGYVRTLMEIFVKVDGILGSSLFL